MAASLPNANVLGRGPARRRGLRPVVRHVVVLGLLAVSANVVLPQIARAGATAAAVGRFQWNLVPAIVVASAVTYAMAAVSLMAASGVRLPFARTLAAQVAAAFANRLLPAGTGAMATNVRYLVRSGVPRARAVGAVGLDSAAGFVVHVTGMVAVAVLFHRAHVPLRARGPDVGDNWPLLVGVAVVMAAAGITAAAVRLHGRFGPALRRATLPFGELARDRRRAALLLGASAGLTAAYVAALCLSVRAAGGGPAVLSIVAVYLGGAALAAAAPTPGGLGALEAGLIAGLAAVGQPAAGAVTAVLVFRLVTYWLPVLPGGLLFWSLRRREAL